jgi:hypothetical protein
LGAPLAVLLVMTAGDELHFSLQVANCCADAARWVHRAEIAVQTCGRIAVISSAGLTVPRAIGESIARDYNLPVQVSPSKAEQAALAAGGPS